MSGIQIIAPISPAADAIHFYRAKSTGELGPLIYTFYLRRFKHESAQHRAARMERWLNWFLPGLLANPPKPEDCAVCDEE